MIHHGDCVTVMASMEPDSFDAIVTDPPYGLEFMGKEWDRLDGAVIRDPATERGGFQDGNGGNPYSRSRIEYGRRDTKAMQDWHHRWATEALRVAKPGAHLLAFGGTRTYHRLTCALEDAGWEIRDCLVYAYAQGFPKSHNLDRSEAFCHCDRTSTLPEYDVRGVRDTDLSATGQDANESESVLLSPLPQHGSRVRRTNGADVTQAQAALWASEPGVERRSDVLQDARQLHRGQVRQGAGVGASDGPQGRVHHGAPAGDGVMARATADEDGSGEPSRPRSGEQRPDEPGALADERGPQARGVWPRCDRCGKSQIPRGLGTALKPAWEPIVLARKPLRGTVAGNVERYGTGALNIDGTRIPSNGEAWDGAETDDYGGVAYGGSLNEQRSESHPAGRWPPNLLLTDAELFDVRNDGVVGSGTDEEGLGYSRMFLVPKASRSDREPVWGEQTAVDAKLGLRHGGPGEPGKGSKEGYAYHPKPRRNTHPTTKPIDLMRHLVRLVTPPQGKILDPFLGSGTTAIAAIMEGFECIGIEREAEYVAIAEARLNGVQQGIGL